MLTSLLLSDETMEEEEEDRAVEIGVERIFPRPAMVMSITDHTCGGPALLESMSMPMSVMDAEGLSSTEEKWTSQTSVPIPKSHRQEKKAY